MSENKISVKEQDKVISENYNDVTEAEWHGIPAKIHKLLPFAGMLRFVDSVVESCFIADTGAYIPEIKDFAIRCCILTMYGNFELPEDLEQKYALVYKSDAVAFVTERIDSNQINQMMTAIDKKIEHRAQSNIEALNKQMSEIASDFDALEEKLEDVFGGIDGDTVSKIASAITNGSFDEKKLVQAFTENISHKSNVVPLRAEEK